MLVAFLVSLLVACGETTDSIGYGRLEGPLSYPNAFGDVLGKTEREIDDKIESTFEALFYGDPETQAIYFLKAEDKALIQDTLHRDTRTEGIGLGMMITVQLDKQSEFDRLWRYAKADLRYTSGANHGYFRSHCSTVDPDQWPECADPYGHQLFVMSLLFAANRWGRTSGDIDYLEDARATLDVMRSKEPDGAASRGVTNMFDEKTALVLDVPEASFAGITRPSVEMPAYYELWGQATRDPFWTRAAEAARAHWKLTAQSENGLMPLRAEFDGTPVPGFDTFRPEGYRTQLNLVLDQIWFDADPWQVEISNRTLEFFAPQETTATSYALDGEVIDTAHEPALVIVNGVSALSATVPQRRAFINDVWEMELREGPSRYFHGILDLTALLILSGRFRVY